MTISTKPDSLGFEWREASGRDRYAVVEFTFCEISKGVRCVWPEPLVIDGLLIVDGALKLEANDW